MPAIITLSTPRGDLLHLCPTHDRKSSYRHPRTGEEYCQVHQGQRSVSPTCEGCAVCAHGSNGPNHRRID